MSWYRRDQTAVETALRRGEDPDLTTTMATGWVSGFPWRVRARYDLRWSRSAANMSGCARWAVAPDAWGRCRLWNRPPSVEQSRCWCRTGRCIHWQFLVKGSSTQDAINLVPTHPQWMEIPPIFPLALTLLRPHGTLQEHENKMKQVGTINVSKAVDMNIW